MVFPQLFAQYPVLQFSDGIQTNADRRLHDYLTFQAVIRN